MRLVGPMLVMMFVAKVQSPESAIQSSPHAVIEGEFVDQTQPQGHAFDNPVTGGYGASTTSSGSEDISSHHRDPSMIDSEETKDSLASKKRGLTNGNEDDASANKRLKVDTSPSSSNPFEKRYGIDEIAELKKAYGNYLKSKRSDEYSMGHPSSPRKKEPRFFQPCLKTQFLNRVTKIDDETLASILNKGPGWTSEYTKKFIYDKYIENINKIKNNEKEIQQFDTLPSKCQQDIKNVIGVKTKRIIEFLQKIKDLAQQTEKVPGQADPNNIPGDPQVIESPPVEKEAPFLQPVITPEKSDVNEVQNTVQDMTPNTEPEMTQNNDPMEWSWDDFADLAQSIENSGEQLTGLDEESAAKLLEALQTNDPQPQYSGSQQENMQSDATGTNSA